MFRVKFGKNIVQLKTYNLVILGALQESQFQIKIYTYISSLINSWTSITLSHKYFYNWHVCHSVPAIHLIHPVLKRKISFDYEINTNDFINQCKWYSYTAITNAVIYSARRNRMFTTTTRYMSISVHDMIKNGGICRAINIENERTNRFWCVVEQ